MSRCFTPTGMTRRSRPKILAGTMQRLVEEGKILGYGLSEVAPYTVERAHAVHPVMAVQNEYSLWTRQPELGLIQLCARLGVAFVPFSPLARGVFGTPMADPATFAEGEFRTRIPRFHPENWPHNRAETAGLPRLRHKPRVSPRQPSRWPGFWTAGRM
jgi:aryl-alcohol dehydrogenase-like predicted oxidoreductase